MARGTNSWSGSGNVASDVAYGRTSKEDLACNFRLAVEQGKNYTGYFRVNVYGPEALSCQRKYLGKGDYVVIEGELMNRSGEHDILTEIRCTRIVIQKKKEG